MNNILITFACPIYEPTLEEVTTWIGYFKKLNEIKDVQCIFLNDNPNLDEQIKKKINESNIEFIDTNINRKTVNLFIYSSKQNYLKGKYIKKCDPDDFLLIEKTIEFISWLRSQKKIKYIIYQPIVFEDKNPNFKKWYFLKFGVNYNSLIIADDIKKQNELSTPLTIGDDLLFYLFSIYQSRKVKYIKSYFYIWNFEKGISSIKPDKQSNTNVFYEHLNFIKLLFEQFTDGFGKIKLGSYFPTQAFKFLENSSMEDQQKFNLRNEYLNIYEKIKKSKK